MVKYARIVFEEEIPDGATLNDAMDIVMKSVENYLLGHPNKDDIEIHDRPYIADECNSDDDNRDKHVIDEITERN